MTGHYVQHDMHVLKYESNVKFLLNG